ncbi:baseplate wedge initiator [Synechococcus phage S-CAM9]|uniref:Baseplate wedge initiator n=1 Tax=Synechococcus phage S-CAM9 TaxID=1883369 RepID=A0A1D8KP45_9CAUD|nr:baseplate wedge initiator [Synechococcus phage S-CAM9]
MIDTSFQKVQVNQVIFSQLPSFVQEENPLFVDFLKTYYLGEEYQGGNIDITQNFNDYQKVETFSGNENLVGFTTCTSKVNFFDSTIEVVSTDGWPEKYGLLKINDEIISYTGKTKTSFTGCLRGFSGVESLHSKSDPEQLVFSKTFAATHKIQTQVINLSNLFLQEFWQNLKNLFLPGFEDRKIINPVDKANFLRQAKDLFASKGTSNAIEILFRVLYGKDSEVIKPIDYLFAPSDADYIKTTDVVAELISGDPTKIAGQELRQTGDNFTSASIFDVKFTSRNNRSYYQISLSKETLKGNFKITGSSSLTNNVSIGDTVLTVDSTLGFEDSGEIYVGAGLTVGIVTYTNKSSTQFFDVVGLSSSYSDGQFVRSSNTVFSYENGDISKPVLFRLTAVATGSPLQDVGYLVKNDILKGKTLGNLSLASNQRLNTWVHNIKTTTDVSKDIRTNISNIDIVTNTVNTKDPHLLKFGDPITLVDLTSNIPQNVEGTVSQVVSANVFQLNIISGTIDVGRTYKVRSNTIFASHNDSNVKVDEFVAEVQNTYIDKTDENVYVASGSLPAYKIYATNRKKTFFNSDINSDTGSINIVSHGFITGDLIKYSPVSVGQSALPGLSTNTDYIVSKVDSDNIKLSRSSSDAVNKRYINIQPNDVINHQVLPTELFKKDIKHQNFLRRFPKTPTLNKFKEVFLNEPIGMFKNGVEIVSNRSGDFIRYGIVKNIEVQNGGSNFDLVSPPNINISDSVGTGATAYAIIENGKFEGIEVVSAGYDIKKTPNVVITGGNGNGATAVARLKESKTTRTFNAESDVNITIHAVTFVDRHLFDNGESVYYKKADDYDPIGGLVDNSLYYLNVVDDFTVKFMSSYEDAVAGINPIVLTSKSTGTNSLQSTKIRKVLGSIVVTDPGSGYSNRRLEVSSSPYPSTDYTTVDDIVSGINTANNYVYFKQHGFNDGDLIEYHSSGPISGLSTTQNYQVLKLDEDRFRVCSAGIGTTSSNLNYRKLDYVKFDNNGTSTHTFKYPDIHVSVETISGVANTAYSQPRVRPLCRGEIVQCPLIAPGVGYGSSDVINVHRRPNVQVSNGSNGVLDVFVDNGKIVQCFIVNAGGGYVTPPEVIINGDGKYAKIITNITDGKISSVTIVDTGKGYTSQNTTISLRSPGFGAKLEANVDKWDIDIFSKYRNSISENDDGLILPSQNDDYGAKFVHAYAGRKLRFDFNDNIQNDFSERPTVNHSPILGWAYDGSPIYGPYGHGFKTGGAIRRMIPGYTLVSKGNRPPVSLFPLGYFINDYIFTNDGDLDEFNGRFCKTPEYPDGVYAYFCTIQATNSSKFPFVNTREPAFPYVLNNFKYKKDSFNQDPSSIQSLPILNSGDLIRNTYNYKFGFANSNYDYLTTNQVDETQLIVRTTVESGISTINIVSPGENYKVNDKIRFNNLNSGGSESTAKVKTLVGSGLSSLSYEREVVSDIEFLYGDRNVVGVATTAHNLSNNDLVIVGGIGTGELKFIQGPRTIAVSSITGVLQQNLGPVSDTGITTTILLSVPSSDSDSIDVDDIISIGTDERVIVLEKLPFDGRYRISRPPGYAGTHFSGELVHVDQRKFSYDVGINTDLKTQQNRKIVFNPVSSIGIGTTVIVKSIAGIGTTTAIRVKSLNDIILEGHELPPEGSDADNTITINSHGFRTGQRLTYNIGRAGIALTVSNSVSLSNPFQLVDGQYVYAVNKGTNLLGITTTITGIGTTSASLYFTGITTTGTEHFFKESNKDYTGHVERYDVTVVTNFEHTLKSRDNVKIDISPNTTVSKTIEFNTIARKTLVDGYYVSAASTFIGVGATNSVITITDHEFVPGQKLLYEAGSSEISPLVNNGEYFAQVINDNQFRLSTNYKDATSFGGNFIGITTFGVGVHKFSAINPHIVATRGQTIGFAVSDNSLNDLKLEFYEDENFVTKYDGAGVSTEITRSTAVPGSNGSLVNLKLTENVPTPLYYKLEPTNLDGTSVSKRDANPDNTVAAGSKIIINNSVYSGTFSISTTGTNTFQYQVDKKPESEIYTSSGINTFRYITDSKTARGGINEIKVTFGGVKYRRNPGISTIITDTGKNAILRIYDDSIGRPANTEMLSVGYEYPSDRSLQPSVDLPTIVTISNNFALNSVGVTSGGKNYINAPELIVPGAEDIDLTAVLSGTSVGEVIVNRSGKGFNEVPNPPRIIPVRNSNGIGIVSTSSNGETNTLILAQPLNGWTPNTFPFSINDRIFVEGVGTAQTVFATTGGYNSENYNYSFFTVNSISPLTSKLTYSIAGLGTTGGTYDPDTSAGRVIKQSDLPTFTGGLNPEPFFEGEKITFGSNGTGFVLDQDGYDNVTNTLRLRSLSTPIRNGDVIRGTLSRAVGTVRNFEAYSDFFNTNFGAEKEKGFQKNTGKLNDDFQKLEDSDYYQNFSYSIKSEVPIETWKSAVDSIVHPTGYKNFSDLVVKSQSTAGFARSLDLKPENLVSDTSLLVSIDNEKSFFTRDDFDLAGETLITEDISKFIDLRNRKIASFINVISNKVDIIDDIAPQFTGIGTTTSAEIVGLSSFRLTSSNEVLFTKIFDPSDTDVVSLGSSVIRINNHNFQTGERIKYDPGGAYGNNRIGIDTTSNVLGGISTDKMPAEVFAIKLNNNFFSVAGVSTAADLNDPLVIIGVGTGTEHSFDVLRPDDRVIIEIDEIIQPPLFRKRIDIELAEAVGIGSTTIKVVGVTSMSASDLINIDNEILEITNIGIGSTNSINVNRGVLGTVAAAHTIGAACTARGGSFHIVKDVIHFVTPPYGPTGFSTLSPGIGTQSSFQGRLFNRKNPTTNFIFDDISPDFIGIGKTYTLLQEGQPVSGIVTTISGPEVVNQGIILIDNITQRPTIDFNMIQAQDPGIGGSIIFTGSNRDNLPKGGIVNEFTIGIGSGYQPLVAAAATAVVNGAGSIESVVVTGGGSGYRSGPVPIQVLNPLGIGSTAVLQGTIGAAGTVTGITTVSGGSGYASTTPPIIVIGIDTGYSNMSYTGGSGNGFKASVVVGSGGSIIDLQVTDFGIGYKNNEVLTVAGIPSDAVGAAFSSHTITINSLKFDKFAGFSFGQLLELDDFSNLFNGVRDTFTLTRTTLDKRIININTEESNVYVANNLLIFLNDVLQQPGQAYQFEGGTQVTFTEPPKAGSKLQILFFRGSNEDIDDGDPFSTIKIGDFLQLQRKDASLQQNQRPIIGISGVSQTETILYAGKGINDDPKFTRSLSWTKQKQDFNVDGQSLSKARANDRAQIQPTASIIVDVGVGSEIIYVDNAFPLFSAYDNRSIPNQVPIGGVQLLRYNDIERADGVVSVSAGGTVSIGTVTDPGRGYQSVPKVAFASTIEQIREIGKTWTKRSSYIDVEYQSIDRNSFGLFVAVGSTTGINTSTDAITWRDSGNSTIFGDLNGVVGMTTHTVIVGASGTVGYSTDGRNYQPSKLFRRRNVFPLILFDDITVTQDFNDVTFGQSVGVAVGAAGTIAFTNAGAAGFGTAFEVTQKYSSINLNGVGANQNVFVAVGENGTILRSNNGESWTGVSTSSVTTNLNHVHYANGQWIAVGVAGTIVRSSDNGLTWNIVSAGSTFDLNRVGYANSVWVAIGQSGMVLNSVDTNTWYKKFVGVGTDFNGLAFGDNKLVTVGLSSNIYSSQFETVSAAGTATVSAAGTISAININEGGFGYNPYNPVEVIIEYEPIVRETITSVEVEGDYGDVVSVASSTTGIGTDSPMLIFELDSDSFLDQAAFGDISKSGIGSNQYFVITNSVTGAPTTSITDTGSSIGVGKSFLDNVYFVSQRDFSNSGIVTVFCNVESIAGIGTTDFAPRIGKYSWGRLFNYQRDRLNPKSFPAEIGNGIAGLSTSSTATRRSQIAENYNDLDQTS